MSSLNFVRQIKIWQINGLMSTIMILITSLSIVATAWFSLRDDAVSSSILKQDVSIRSAASMIKRSNSSAIIDWSGDNVTKISMDSIPSYFDHSMIDEISRITSDTVTIFKYDVSSDDFIRVTTSIKKMNGERAIGTKLDKTGEAFKSIKRKEIYRGEADILGVSYYTVYMPIFSSSTGDVIGILYAGVKKESVVGHTFSLIEHISFISLVLVVFLSGFSLFISRKMMHPITVISNIIDRISHNDVSMVVPFQNREDEIGMIASSVNILRDNTVEKNRLEQEKSVDDEKRRIMNVKIGDLIDKFRVGISNNLDSLEATVSEMRSSSSLVSNGTSMTVDKSNEAVDLSSKVSANMQSVASATEELAFTINEISSQVSKTMNIVDDATRYTREANEKIDRLSKSTFKIGEVITLIQTIASQTNLLALNATIEAARAGEAGRGFAVVASEVKGLSGQTAKATEEISSHIGAIQMETESVVEAIGLISSIMNEINILSASMSAAMEQQGSATQEISSNAASVSHGTSDMTTNIEMVLQTAKTTSDTMSRMERSADDVKSSADIMRSTIDMFLFDVAAA